MGKVHKTKDFTIIVGKMRIAAASCRWGGVSARRGGGYHVIFARTNSICLQKRSSQVSHIKYWMY